MRTAGGQRETPPLAALIDQLLDNQSHAGMNLLEKAEDSPKEGPVLVITNGYCDRLHVKREHVFLLPEGHSLPFAPRGKVFRIR